ncbi:MAG: hypothetical protein M3O99_10455 [Chloroflexota bacterium]|nr:hypothetical protein [Chloroflexota bacterium]
MTVEKERSDTSGTLTFLFADLRGYTAYVESRGDAAAAELIADYRRIVRAQVAQTGGGEIKTEGDSFYIVFSTARRAVECGIAIFKAVEHQEAAHPERPMRIGIGIHAGEPVLHDGQYVGSAVNLAARLGQNARSGELLISDVVRGLLRTSNLPPITERRRLTLKGIADGPRAYSVEWRQPAVPVSPPSALGAGASRRRNLIVPGGAVLGVLVAVVFVIGLLARPSVPTPSVLQTIAGLGTPGFSGDRGPATAAQLDAPTSLVVDPAGNLYVADSSLSLPHGFFEEATRIRRIDRDGTITTIAGDGDSSAVADFGYLMHFAGGTHIASDPTGRIYLTGISGLAQGDAPWVATLELDGRFRLIAGAQLAGYSGDGGPALKGAFVDLRGLAVDGSGDVFVADSGSSVIREVRADRILATVAGTGARGFSGEGGIATSAQLFAPVAVAISPDGSLYIADTNNNRVRKIDHGGNIVTVAGDGTAGYAGDGGPAGRAALKEPSGLAFDSAGNLYIADAGNNRIRKVALDGTISTVAGDGSPETLRAPSALVVSAGTLYIADTGNHRIRKVSLVDPPR